MKYILLVSCIILLNITSCKKDSSLTPSPILTKQILGKWVLEYKLAINKNRGQLNYILPSPRPLYNFLINNTVVNNSADIASYSIKNDTQFILSGDTYLKDHLYTVTEITDTSMQLATVAPFKDIRDSNFVRKEYSFIRPE